MDFARSGVGKILLQISSMEVGVARYCQRRKKPMRLKRVLIGEASMAEPGRGSATQEFWVCGNPRCRRFGRRDEETIAGN